MIEPRIVVTLALSKVATGVADPGCLFRIPDPIFLSRIQSLKDPGSENLSIFNPKNVSKLSEISNILVADATL
jgi:hypothetical protein